MKILIDIPSSNVADLKKKPNKTETDNRVLNGMILSDDDYDKLINSNFNFCPYCGKKLVR